MQPSGIVKAAFLSRLAQGLARPNMFGKAVVNPLARMFDGTFNRSGNVLKAMGATRAGDKLLGVGKHLDDITAATTATSGLGRFGQGAASIAPLAAVMAPVGYALAGKETPKPLEAVSRPLSALFTASMPGFWLAGLGGNAAGYAHGMSGARKTMEESAGNTAVGLYEQFSQMPFQQRMQALQSGAPMGSMLRDPSVGMGADMDMIQRGGTGLPWWSVLGNPTTGGYFHGKARDNIAMKSAAVGSELLKRVGSSAWAFGKGMFGGNKPYWEALGNKTLKTIPNWKATTAGIGTGMVGLGGLGGYAMTKSTVDDEASRAGSAAAAYGMDQQLASLRNSPGSAMLASMDPTILMMQAERQRPGTIAEWEKRTGRPFSPGLLGGVLDTRKNSGAGVKTTYI